MKQIKLLQNAKFKGGCYLLGDIFEFDSVFLKFLIANRINHSVTDIKLGNA